MLLEKLGLKDTLPMFGTSDNASNMVKGLGQSLLEMYGCNNHTQQLAILAILPRPSTKLTAPGGTVGLTTWRELSTTRSVS